MDDSLNFFEFIGALFQGEDHYIRESVFIFGHMAGFFIAMKKRNASTSNCLIYIILLSFLGYLLAHKTW